MKRPSRRPLKKGQFKRWATARSASALMRSPVQGANKEELRAQSARVESAADKNTVAFGVHSNDLPIFEEVPGHEFTLKEWLDAEKTKPYLIPSKKYPEEGEEYDPVTPRLRVLQLRKMWQSQRRQGKETIQYQVVFGSEQDAWELRLYFQGTDYFFLERKYKIVQRSRIYGSRVLARQAFLLGRICMIETYCLED